MAASRSTWWTHGREHRGNHRPRRARARARATQGGALLSSAIGLELSASSWHLEPPCRPELVDGHSGDRACSAFHAFTHGGQFAFLASSSINEAKFSGFRVESR